MVGDLPVSDREHDDINEDDGTDTIRELISPLSHLFDRCVGSIRDTVFGDLGPKCLIKTGRDLTSNQYAQSESTRFGRLHPTIYLRRLLTICGSEGGILLARNAVFHRSGLSDHRIGSCAATRNPPWPWVVPVAANMFGHLRIPSSFDNLFRQPTD